MFARLFKDISLTNQHQLNLLATNLEHRLKQNTETGTVIWELDRIVTAMTRVRMIDKPTTSELVSYHPDRIVIGDAVYYIDDKSHLNRFDSSGLKKLVDLHSNRFH